MAQWLNAGLRSLEKLDRLSKVKLVPTSPSGAQQTHVTLEDRQQATRALLHCLCVEHAGAVNEFVKKLRRPYG